MSEKRPLNGTKTHRLSKYALGVLADLARGPIPRYRINPGVYDRLWREDLAEQQGIMIAITEAGRDVLKVPPR